MTTRNRPPPPPPAARDPEEDARSRLLRTRAQALAEPTQASDRREHQPLLVFALAGERLGVDLQAAREVFRLEHLTPIPGAPPHVLGVTQLRGTLLMLIDLPQLLGHASPGMVDLTQVIVLGDPGREVGLLAENMEGIVDIDPLEVGPAPVPHPLIRGVTRDRLVWLDAGKLVRHEHSRP